MSDIKDGEQAFPTSHEEPAEYDGHNRSIKTVVDQGMPLRDYFAAKAMNVCPLKGHDDTAEWCYRRADAMLKARKS